MRNINKMFTPYDTISLQSPNLSDSDLKIVNWAEFKTRNGESVDVVELTNPYSLINEDGVSDFVLPIYLSETADGLGIRDDIKVGTHNICFDIKNDISTNSFGDKFITAYLGSFHGLTNSLFSLYCANVGYDIIGMSGLRPSMSMSPYAIGVYNISSHIDLARMYGLTLTSTASVFQWEAKIRSRLKEYRNDFLLNKNNFPLNDANSFGHTEAVLGFREPVRFFLGYSKVSKSRKPKQIGNSSIAYPESIDMTQSLRENAMPAQCYRWLPIFDGTNVSEIIKRMDADIGASGHFVYTVKVEINLTQLKMLFGEILNSASALADVSNLSSPAKASFNNSLPNFRGTRSSSVLAEAYKESYGLRIYPPSFISTGVDAVEDFEIPVSGDSSSSYDKFVWKMPKIYTSDSNVQFAIGFDIEMEDDKKIQFIDSSMGGSRCIIDGVEEPHRTFTSGDSLIFNSINSGLVTISTSDNISSGFFSASKDGYSWLSMPPLVPVFSSIAYNSINTMLVPKTQYNAEGTTASIDYANVPSSAHKDGFIAYTPSVQLQNILQGATKINATVWAFDGSQGIFGTKNGIQDIPTNTWL